MFDIADHILNIDGTALLRATDRKSGTYLLTSIYFTPNRLLPLQIQHILHHPSHPLLLVPLPRPTHYFAGHCACTSCRTTSGSPIQRWTFIPSATIFFYYQSDSSEHDTHEVALAPDLRTRRPPTSNPMPPVHLNTENSALHAEQRCFDGAREA
ncbi:hypothetical protein H2248_012072 [Termitomyces sp. 'cryptogamus']|nr:hypothetical protein H2248_012072 [Termitomyces sp. 'cryptogamus']